MRGGEIAGLNVTIPFKQSIIQYLDALSPTAQAIGAVNTLYLHNNKLMGDNTDAPGFLADLKRFPSSGPSQEKREKRALVLGAGGAARAVVFALVRDGWEVKIAARRPEQVRALMDQFSEYRQQLAAIPYNAEAFETQGFSIRLVINTTPVGMVPKVSASPWPSGVQIPFQADCYDLVYNPAETRFIREARAAGHLAASGLGMLVEQAALSFKIWTGFDIFREFLFSALEGI
jgi:shikimate dehydrogenase